MKNSNKISAFILLIFISVCSVMTIKNADDFPDISWQDILNGNTGDKLSSYIAYNFPWRDDLVSVSAGLEAGINESIVNDVYISKKRLLAVDISAYGNTENFSAMVNDFAGKYDGAVYFTAVPTSSGVYSNMLPPYMATSSEKQCIDNLYEQLDSDIRKIDAYNILKMLSDNYIYYRSDSRWTSYGAFCVYRTVIQRLGFMPLSYDKYTIEHITDNYKGNLYSRTQYMDSKPDLLDIYEYSGGSEVTECIGIDNSGMVYRRSLYDRMAIESDDMYNLYLGEPLPFFRICTGVNNDRKLLVVGDDYVSCFIPFLIQHYSEIAVVYPEYMEKNLNKFVNPDNYEQTLILFGTDSLDDDIFGYMR